MSNYHIENATYVNHLYCIVDRDITVGYIDVEDPEHIYLSFVNGFHIQVADLEEIIQQVKLMKN